MEFISITILNPTTSTKITKILIIYVNFNMQFLLNVIRLNYSDHTISNKQCSIGFDKSE